jgi:accessory gene regulator protein AgrB
MISLVPFRTFRGPLFPKPVTGQELFLVVSYSKPALSNNSQLTFCGIIYYGIEIIFHTLHPILTFLGVGSITSLVRNTIFGAIFLVYRFKKNKQQIFQKKRNKQQD